MRRWLLTKLINWLLRDPAVGKLEGQFVYVHALEEMAPNMGCFVSSDGVAVRGASTNAVGFTKITKGNYGFVYRVL